MVTLKDINSDVAAALTELRDSLKEIGQEEEGQKIVDNVLVSIEQGRKEAAEAEALEGKVK